MYIGTTHLKKMGDFIEPETHRSTNINVKIDTLLKKSEIKCILVIQLIAMNPKILYIRFQT